MQIWEESFVSVSCILQHALNGIPDITGYDRFMVILLKVLVFDSIIFNGFVSDKAFRYSLSCEYITTMSFVF